MKSCRQIICNLLESYNSPAKIARRALRPAFDLVGGLRRKYYGPITHVRTTSKLAALTFDDGPHPKYTVELLEILASFGAKATFFMIGQRAIQYPELVKLVADHGHAIGNHSFSHPSFPTVDAKTRQNEIQRCEAALRPHMVKLFRPPFGSENLFCHRELHRFGYRVVKWNVAADDWEEHSPEWIADRLLRQIEPGVITLLHDNLVDKPESNRTQTLEAVRKVLRETSGRLTFCTVPHLLAAGTPMRSFQAI